MNPLLVECGGIVWGISNKGGFAPGIVSASDGSEMSDGMSKNKLMRGSIRGCVALQHTPYCCRYYVYICSFWSVLK